ncbi:MAG: LuxR C-terminal-related transcriptional regulator, partial [Anaerolineae bacterium]
MDQPKREQPTSDIDRLTERELEIIKLMQAGLSNKEIARQMSLAYETIKWYSKRIYSKLNIKNRNQLASRLESLPHATVKPPADEPSRRWAMPLTTFIGRSAEKEALLEQVANNRLVSLVGPGGIGKTRLALELYRLAPARFERTAYLISAEPFHTSEELLFGLADLFHVSLNHFDSPLNQIAAGLPTSPTLLIIDNFETIIDAAADLVTLLTGRASLHILVTSRSVLRLKAETIFRLDGLAQGKNDFNSNEAVHLFQLRAHLNLEADSIGESQSEIAEICQIVGGSPLAIELAASWTRSLTCAQILAELQSGLNILTSDAADIDERHRSMEAICEQSWLTLKPVERRAALKLSLFESRFTWEAAREIASISLQTVTGLLDQSIIRRVPGGRLSMHPVLRRFIQQQQKRLKFDPTPTQNRFANYYIQRLIASGEEIHSAKQIVALDGIELELDHILQAWRWAAQAQQTDLLQRALEPLALYLEIRDHSKQGAMLFAETRQALHEDGVLALGLLLFQAWYEIWLGNTEEGTAAMFQALERLDHQGLSAKWPLPISMLSFNEQFPADIRQSLEARYSAEKEGYLSKGDKRGAAWMAYGLGNITRPDERFEESAANFRESLQLFQTEQNYFGISFALDGLSTTLARMGDLDGAWETALQLKATS